MVSNQAPYLESWLSYECVTESIYNTKLCLEFEQRPPTAPSSRNVLEAETFYSAPQAH